MTLNVVELFDSNFRDPVANLRKIADRMEAGEYGPVGTCALVVMGDQMEVFGMGPESEGAGVALLLHAAFLRLAQAVESHGK